MIFIDSFLGPFNQMSLWKQPIVDLWLLRNFNKRELCHEIFIGNLQHLKIKCYTAQKMKFSIKDLVTFNEEILNGKLHFLCNVKN